MVSFTQAKHVISSTIRDKSTGEALIGATVILLERPGIGATSNSYGFYSLTAPDGSYTMVISFADYTADTLKLT